MNKFRPIHENLDTAYINLSALIVYLRRRQFIGKVRVELNSYEADIVFEPNNKVKIREHDILSGRRAEGKEALNRLLVRAREAGGTVNVYQSTIQEVEPIAQQPIDEVKPKSNGKPQNGNLTINGNGLRDFPHGLNSIPLSNGTAAKPARIENILESPTSNGNEAKPIDTLPKSRFHVNDATQANSVTPNLTAAEWQILLRLAGELLNTIDRTLAEAKLDFAAAFHKVRGEISSDYPFMHPTTGTFIYDGGQLSMPKQISPGLLSAGINESLRRMLDKLGGNPKFSEVHQTATRRILALMNQRKAHYEKYLINPELKRTLGV